MTAKATITRLQAEMTTRFQVGLDRVRIVRAPYRICPLGAHIDHQLGPVTAMAIDRAVHLAYAPSGSREVRLRSLDFPGEVRFSLDAIGPAQAGDWGNYARGAATALREKFGLDQGIVGITAGKMGEGGLSSSAAIGVAYLLALEDANRLQLTPRDNIELDRMIENEYLGLRNGILDQSAILLSRKDHLTLIDCKAVTHRLVPRPEALSPFAILIAFSGLSQALITTGYNLRVRECNEAAAILLRAAGRPDEPPFLGNVTRAEYLAHRAKLSGAPARRAEHFFSEAERVERGVKAWQQGDLATFGRLMTESGRSSIEKYECGCPPLIDLYETLVRTEGVYGSRFSGAGFRGCCVALADPAAAAGAAARVREAYSRRYPDLAPNAPVLICQSDDGARIL